jgi:hypothetical protein
MSRLPLGEVSIGESGPDDPCWTKRILGVLRRAKSQTHRKRLTRDWRSDALHIPDSDQRSRVAIALAQRLCDRCAGIVIGPADMHRNKTEAWSSEAIERGSSWGCSSTREGRCGRRSRRPDLP